MTDHSTLISNLESVTEGSRELDAAVALFAGWKLVEFDTDFGPSSQWCCPTGGVDKLPFFTTSLDAALTLVPEGFWWRLYGPDNRGRCEAMIFEQGKNDHDGWGTTPALALCIASLKARKGDG